MGSTLLHLVSLEKLLVQGLAEGELGGKGRFPLDTSPQFTDWLPPVIPQRGVSATKLNATFSWPPALIFHTILSLVVHMYLYIRYFLSPLEWKFHEGTDISNSLFLQ